MNTAPHHAARAAEEIAVGYFDSSFDLTAEDNAAVTTIIERAIEAAVAEAQSADTKRLDWLIDHQEFYKSYKFHMASLEPARFGNARQAIDAAMPTTPTTPAGGLPVKE